MVVRIGELEHCVERAWVLGTGATIELTDPVRGLESTYGDSAANVPELRRFLERCERSHLIEVLERQSWAVGKSAEELGISRKNRWERMRRLGSSAPGTAGA